MTTFEFATAGRIVFGAGVFDQAPRLARELGKSVLVVCGARRELAERFLTLLAEQGMTGVLFQIPREPTIELVAQGAAVAREFHCDCLVGVGGGSVIDGAKAIAALATNEGEALDYLEVVGKGKALLNPPLPYLAIPTTAGTGAEVTRNAVITCVEQRVKASLRSPLMLPRLALVDPRLTLDLPPALTASTGMDALTQLIEPFVSCRANPMTDAVCREGMAKAARSLRRAFHHGEDEAAREDMALASLMGGLALANAGLGAVHGFAAPLGGMFPAPHGAVCAKLLPIVMEVNLRALRRKGARAGVDRFDEVARLLTGKPTATADEGVEWVGELCLDLGIPSLGTFGLTRGDILMLIEKARTASSMKANPVVLENSELEEILERGI